MTKKPGDPGPRGVSPHHITDHARLWVSKKSNNYVLLKFLIPNTKRPMVKAAAQGTGYAQVSHLCRSPSSQHVPQPTIDIHQTIPFTLGTGPSSGL